VLKKIKALLDFFTIATSVCVYEFSVTKGTNEPRKRIASVEFSQPANLKSFYRRHGLKFVEK